MFAAWRIVISQATEQSQCYIPSLYVVHFKGSLNSGEAQQHQKSHGRTISGLFLIAQLIQDLTFSFGFGFRAGVSLSLFRGVALFVHVGEFAVPARTTAIEHPLGT
jgi:hypothetical protein